MASPTVARFALELVDGFLIKAWRLRITIPRRMRNVAYER
jgi:hypothetical protein